MTTKRRSRSRKPADDQPDDEGISEEEAEALAGAPAEGESELPPLDVENLQPFPPEAEEDLSRPFAPEALQQPFQYEDELESMGVRDDSVQKAQDASSIMREANAHLLLHRVEPSEYRGLRTRGFIRKFHAPFSIEEAQVWAAENRGGGKYRYWIYDGRNVIRGGSTFEISGNPKSPEEIIEAENVAATKTQRGEGDRERERDLERQLGDERMDRMMQMMMQQRREDQAENRRMMEKLADAAQKPERNAAADWAPVIAALAPIMVKVLEKPEPPPPPPDHFKEIAVLQERFQTEMIRMSRDQMEQRGKPDKHEMMMTKMMEAMMQKSLGIGQHDPMAGINLALDTVLPGLVKKLTNVAVDKAIGGDKEEDKELSPRFIAEKVADLVKDTTEKFTNRGAPQAPPPGYGPPQAPPQMLPPPGTAPGHPSAPIDGWPMTGPPTTEEVPPQQMAHDAMQAPPGQPQVQQVQINPGETKGGITNNSNEPLFINMAVDPNQPPPAAAPMPMPAGAPPMDAPPPTAPAPVGPPEGETPPHVHPDVFTKAIEFLNSGQSGEDLAVWADENNQGNRLLSNMAIEYLENTAPFYLVGYIIEAAPPELASAFENPAAKQLVSDFCDFYYNSEDGPEEPEPVAAAAEAPAPDTAAPPAPESETPDA